MNQGVLNSYCWMYSTFNIPPAFQVRQHDGDNDDDDDNDVDKVAFAALFISSVVILYSLVNCVFKSMLFINFHIQLPIGSFYLACRDVERQFLEKNTA